MAAVVFLRYYKRRFYQTEKHVDRCATSTTRNVFIFLEKLLRLYFRPVFQRIKLNVLKASPIKTELLVQERCCKNPQSLLDSLACINLRAQTQKHSWTLTTQRDQSPEKRMPHRNSALGVISLLFLAMTWVWNTSPGLIESRCGRMTACFIQRRI